MAEAPHHRTVLMFLSNRTSRPFRWLSLRQLFLHQRYTPASQEIQLDNHRLPQ